MSDEKEEPRTAEVLKSEAGKVTRIESEGLFPRISHFLFTARREKERLEAHRDVVRAKTQVGEAYIELGRTASRFQDLGNILEADQIERDRNRLSLENRLATERRDAATRELQDELHQEELKARLAEAKAKRQRIEEALKQETTREEKDEETRRREAVRKTIRRKLDGVYTVQELRAEEARLIAEIMRRYGGVLTSDAQREIENIKDAVQQAIDEL